MGQNHAKMSGELPSNSTGAGALRETDEGVEAWVPDLPAFRLSEAEALALQREHDAWAATDSARALATYTDGIERHAAQALADLGHWGSAGAQILKAFADYCGTSVAMIEQHYGRYMGDEPDWIEAAETPRAAAAKGG